MCIVDLLKNISIFGNKFDSDERQRHSTFD